MTANASVETMLKHDAFSAWLGISVDLVEPGRCAARMRVRADMLNGFGVSHGAIVFALADSAMAFAANTGEFVTVALDNAISYPAAVHAGDELVAVAREECSSSRMAFYHVTVRRGDDIVALFRGTVYRTRRKHSTSE